MQFYIKYRIIKLSSKENKHMYKKVLLFSNDCVSGKKIEIFRKAVRKLIIIKTSDWKVKKQKYILVYFYNNQFKNERNKIFIFQTKE